MKKYISDEIKDEVFKLLDELCYLVPINSKAALKIGHISNLLDFGPGGIPELPIEVLIPPEDEDDTKYRSLIRVVQVDNKRREAWFTLPGWGPRIAIYRSFPENINLYPNKRFHAMTNKGVEDPDLIEINWDTYEAQFNNEEEEAKYMETLRRLWPKKRK